MLHHISDVEVYDQNDFDILLEYWVTYLPILILLNHIRVDMCAKN